MFVVVREGVYQQGVFGVYTTLERAKEAAERAVKMEPDKHHNFTLLYLAVNEDQSVIGPRDGYRNLIYKGRIGTLIRNPVYPSTVTGWNMTGVYADTVPGESDHVNQFAYDLLNRDEMALDALADILRK